MRISRLNLANNLELFNCLGELVRSDQQACEILPRCCIFRIKCYSATQLESALIRIASVAICGAESEVCGRPIGSNVDGFRELLNGSAGIALVLQYKGQVVVRVRILRLQCKCFSVEYDRLTPVLLLGERESLVAEICCSLSAEGQRRHAENGTTNSWLQGAHAASESERLVSSDS